MNKRFLIVTGILVAIVVAGFVLFHTYDVQFLSFVVEQTVLEKLDPSLDPATVKTHFEAFRHDLADGRLSHAEYRRALLESSAYIEKIEILHRQDLDRIYNYFEKRKKP